MSDESLTLSRIDRIVMDQIAQLEAFAREHGAEAPEALTYDELKALQMWVWARQWWEDASDEARRIFIMTAAGVYCPQGTFYVYTRDGLYLGRER